jgi:hypothetical protein
VIKCHRCGFEVPHAEPTLPVLLCSPCASFVHAAIEGRPCNSAGFPSQQSPSVDTMNAVRSLVTYGNSLAAVDALGRMWRLEQGCEQDEGGRSRAFRRWVPLPSLPLEEPGGAKP